MKTLHRHDSGSVRRFRSERGAFLYGNRKVSLLWDLVSLTFAHHLKHYSLTLPETFSWLHLKPPSISTRRILDRKDVYEWWMRLHIQKGTDIESRGSTSHSSEKASPKNEPGRGNSQRNYTGVERFNIPALQLRLRSSTLGS